MPIINIDINKIDIDEFNKIIDVLTAINAMPTSSLSLYENGKLISIPEKQLENFRFTGLNNIDFINSKCWKNKF